MGFLLCGCTPKIVRVPFTPEDIIRANEASREGDIAFARKDYYAALIKYLEAGRYNPNSEYIFNKLGITYSQLQFYTEAASAFNRSIGLNPKYPYPFNNLGSVYFATADLKKAEKQFKKAISINASVASFHANLGTLYLERRQPQKGIAELRKALSLDPLIMTKGEAISLAAASNKGPDAEKSYSMARIFASVGDAERAVENLQQALTAGFTDLEAIRSEPDFNPIRQNVKFLEFMKTAGLLDPKP